MNKKSLKAIGSYGFLLGAILAIVLGILTYLGKGDVFGGYTAIIFVVIGLVVGFVNIEPKEAQKFLISTIALMIIGSAGITAINFVGIGEIIKYILQYIVLLAAPASLVVVVQELYRLAKD